MSHSPGTSIVIRINSRLNIQAFVAGMAFMIALLLAGFHIQNQIQTTQDSSTKLLSSIFVGLATGHYMGRIVNEDKSSLSSAYLGALVILSGIILYYGQLGTISGVLAVMAIALFLAHNSGLVEDNPDIKSLIRLISGDIPPFALSGLGIFRYLIPYLIFLGIPENLIQQIINPFVIVLIIVLAFVVFKYLTLRQKTIRIARNSDLMYELGKKNALDEERTDD